MASGIAHDINNAISPVSIYTDILLARERGLTDIGRNSLLTIRESIAGVAQTIARLREFYRPREASLAVTRLSLNPILEQVKELTRVRWRDQMQEQGTVIDCRLETADDLPDVLGVESEIRDAVTNLVLNAIDAMPRGGALTLRTTMAASAPNGAGNGTKACVEVADTGTGMDEETRKRCIDPFYTTKGERGTGLGLSMVYGMAQRHNAALEIDSAPGAGTTVRLKFPIAGTTVVSAVETSTPGAVRPLRVLIIDDDPLLVKALRDALDIDGHAVTSADGGQNGIEEFTRARATPSPFDVVISDLGMPHVDGRKVAAAVKALSPDTPMILLTGWGSRLIADQDTPQYVDRVLSKPPQLGELREALFDLMAARAKNR
jgi:CheY-like chemotaxis protein